MTVEDVASGVTDSDLEQVELPKGAMETLRFARSNPELFVQISESVLKEISEESRARASGSYVSLLRELYDRLKVHNEFKEGDLIRWKAGLKNKRRPADEEPCIVVQVLPETLHNTPETGAGSAYFREPLDLLIGVIDGDKELVIYHVDSRRFEPYPDSATEEPGEAPQG